MFRKTLFWLHLVAGCVAGIIILVMSLTGVLLTYERQMLAYFERGPLRSEPPAGTSRMSVEALTKAALSKGDVPREATLTLRADPREPVEVRAGREGGFYLNPYTGKVMEGGAGKGVASTLAKLRAWHRWLGVEGEGRNAARAITGASNLLFLFIVVSGAYLWLPRRWAWQNVRAVLVFRSEKTGKARDFNWHNVFGIWALVPLFVVVIGAVPISYPWASDLVYRMAGEQPPPPLTKGKGAKGKGFAKKKRDGGGGEERRGEHGPAEAGADTASTVDVNLLWAKAQGQAPGWQSISAPLVVAGGRPVSFTIDTGDGGQPQKRSTLVLRPDSGEVVRWERFEDATPGRQWRMWTRFAHTGEYYGMVGQTIAGVASFAGVMLVYTGIALALRRFWAWRGRRNRRAVEVVEAVGR
ncbi:MAG: PepSY domain-containing protein [Bryobacterales bacterium]|nr:PepSY domain-containing protein [Bryobacterales bacterium]